MSSYFKYFILSLIVPVFFSCSEKEPTADPGNDYFPIIAGQVKIYSVDSITYSAIGNSRDSVRRYLREVIVNETLDSAGFKTYRVELYSAVDTLKGWAYSGYYFYRVDPYQVNLVKGNTTYTIFTFPVIKNKEWNRNAYNSMDPILPYYSYVSIPFEGWAECAEVFLMEDINVIEESVDKETYAKGVGLVYKVYSNIKINSSIKNGHLVITRFLKK